MLDERFIVTDESQERKYSTTSNDGSELILTFNSQFISNSAEFIGL